VAAAQEVFAEQGIDAPLEEIAARADVGIATLYRRFACREQLVAAALIGKVAEYGHAAEAAMAEPDPRAAFTGFVTRICELQAGDRGLADLLSMELPANPEVEQVRAAANRTVIRLIERAKAAGVLRQDFVGEDLLLVMMANAAIAHVTRQDAPDAWRRFAALALDAFLRTDAPPLPAPPSTAQMTSAMLRMARQRGCAASARSADLVQLPGSHIEHEAPDRLLARDERARLDPGD
jgi:AcrR family transcriptional regulator